MPGPIPEIRFRLPHTFLVKPELSIDDGPGRGILVGQNAPREEFNAVFLGKHAEAGHKSVWLDTRGAHAVYVMGKRRSGKSFTLGALAEGLAANSWIRQGEDPQAVLILDTMNVFSTMPFALSDTVPTDDPSVKDARRWGLTSDPVNVRIFAPEGTALPEELNVERITLRASDLGVEEWCGLFDVDPFVDPMGHLIATLIANIAEEGYQTVAGEHEPPKVDYVVRDLIRALDTSTEIRSFSQDTIDALRRRFAALDRLELFGDGGLHVRSLLVPGSVAVLLLRDLEPEMRSVMVSLIVKQVMRFRAISEQQERMIPIHLARAAKYVTTDPPKAEEERKAANECVERAAAGLPRSWLIIDEAHNYIPARAHVPSKKPLKKYVDEGRNLGLSIVVATQQPSGLDPSIQRKADVLLIHALSHHDDIAAAQGMINTAEPDEVVLDSRSRIAGNKVFERLVRALPLGCALVSTDRASRLFPIQVRPRLTVHGGADY